MQGWHNNLNSRVSTRGPVPFYFLVTELFKEASDLPMTLRLVTEGKLRRYQRKKTRQTQGRLFCLWKRYCEREISASHLMSSCGAIYGPQAETQSKRYVMYICYKLCMCVLNYLCVMYVCYKLCMCYKLCTVISYACMCSVF